MYLKFIDEWYKIYFVLDEVIMFLFLCLEIRFRLSFIGNCRISSLVCIVNCLKYVWKEYELFKLGFNCLELDGIIKFENCCWKIVVYIDECVKIFIIVVEN